MRMHFHHFMQFIHQELKVHQGKKDPLSYIAADLARKNSILCFDEFIVNDIVDAMLLGRLFSLLFSKGVCLVTTSNVSPDDLYKNGLQRSLFLPAIALLKQCTKIQYVPAHQDYRLRHTQNNPLQDDEDLERHFSLLTQHAVVSVDPIEICERTIPIIKKTHEVIWFDFNKICNIPRSQHDYLAIARQYHTVFISNLKVILPESYHSIHLFIHMVDVFYDAGVRLILCAALPIDHIYPQGRMATDFIRTRSRLIEMQAWGRGISMTDKREDVE
jgi:cell division protein ZapE